MCGIAGFVDPKLSAQQAAGILAAMGNRLRHRGPDGGGDYFDPAAGVGLASRRLAVIDPSSNGDQPMASPNGRFRLVYNGEIYGFRGVQRELRLKGHAFRGGSDTEVLLQAISSWGLEGALQRCRGMYAFALWDSQAQRLYLARDPIGEKPLYYARLAGGGWAFASELKAIRAHPRFEARVDRIALSRLIAGGYVPAPRSIFEGAFKLLPGCILSINPTAPHAPPVTAPFWSPASQLPSRERIGDERGETDSTDRLESTIRTAVARRLVADVPVGALLSGGVDSSLVVAMMQDLAGRPVSTYTVGFREAPFDESSRARDIAEQLGTNHTQLIVTSDEALAVLPDLPTIYDEPLADASQIPTLLVARLARSEVTVCMSGDGGDELFGGYGRYQETRRIWSVLQRMPISWRRHLARLLPRRPPGGFGRAGRWASRFRDLADAESLDELYQRVLSQCPAGTEGLVVGKELPATDPPSIPDALAGIERLMFTDLLTYLPDDILVKVDRATMAVGLEARLPLLDLEVFDLAWRLPRGASSFQQGNKPLLRKVLERYLPRHLISSRKQGFSVPIAEWLRGPLRPWAADLLADDRLRRQGFLRPELVVARWQEHLSGARDWHTYLWNVLTFQQWLATHGDDDGRIPREPA